MTRDGCSPASYNKYVAFGRQFAACRFVICLVLFCATALAAPVIFPLKDVRAGQKGVGKTVFSGTRIEDFEVEVLGVLENIAPRQSVILAKLSGGPLAQTGVLQGMSGSPVYIDGKLVGAVALGFPGSKEAIAGIRPIEEMLTVDPAVSVQPGSPIALVPRTRVALDAASSSKLEEITTPLAFSGFTSSVLGQFARQLRELGMEPRQGVGSGGRIPDALGDPRQVEPGSMITVQLMSGDMNIAADGTVTAIDGANLYAFGHRFLSTGTTELPFARSEVVALLPNLSSSFKISRAVEWMGSITQDRNAAISGLTGRRAQMTPLEIKHGPNTYRMGMVQDRVMTPLVTQMAVASAIDATGRGVGPATYNVRTKINFTGGSSVDLDNVYTGDVSVSALASLGVASPLSYAMQSGFDALRLKDVSIEVAALDQRRQAQIADVIAPRAARPGEDLEVTVIFSGENGAEAVKKATYRVPVGSSEGPLNITVADATTTNLLELQNSIGVQARTPEQVLTTLKSLRSNTTAYLRVWRSGTSYTVEGRDLPIPPASAMLILNRAQPQASLLSTMRGAKLAEIEVAPGIGVVTGSKTIQVEVRE
jgi:hypothetical protein